MTDWITGKCHAKSGLLFLRDCGNPAVNDCHFCGRPICMDHQIALPSGMACPDCAVREDPEGRFGGNAADRERDRERYYRDHDYSPDDSDDDDFSEDDYRAFDRTQRPDAGEGGEVPASPEKDDLDHFMES